MSEKAKTILFCFIIGLVGYTIGLYSLEIVLHNCRYALYIHEIADSGLTPFPVLFGNPCYDYPALHIFLMYISSLFFREVNMFSMTFPSALAGAVILVFTYLIGEKHSHRFGLIAVTLLGCTYQFLFIARSPSPDMFIAMISVLSFYAVFSADFEQKPLRLATIPFMCLLGFAIRGPIGTIIPVAVVAGYYMATRKSNLLFGMGITCILMMVIGSGWLGVWAYGIDVQKVLYGVTHLFVDKYTGDVPFWYYFVNGMVMYAIALPFAFFAMGTYFLKMGAKYFARESVYTPALLRQALTLWILIIMIGLSFPETKHVNYMVAVIPAAALMAAFIFENFDEISIFDRVSFWLIRIFRYLPLGMVVIMIVGSIVMKMFRIDLDLPLVMPAVCLMIVGAMNFIIPKQKKMKDDTVLVLSMMFVGLVLVNITFFAPIEQRLESSQDFVKKVEQIRPEGLAICFYGIEPEDEILNYLVNIDQKRNFKPKYITLSKNPSEQETLLDLPKNMPIIIRTEDIDSYLAPEIKEKLKVVAEGNLARIKCTVFLPAQPAQR
jgi:4-amino-4-deoxy-L-arabinose transferase-like glycosyltransferase